MKFRSGIEKLAESIESMESASFETDLHKLATDTVKEHESAEIEEQKRVRMSEYHHNHNKKKIRNEFLS